MSIAVLGAETPGDGGAAYLIRGSDAASSRIVSQDGSIWVRAGISLTPLLFGATPDSEGSDVEARNWTAFQCCMHALTMSGGGEVIVPPGVYRLSSHQPILIPDNVTISGIRGASILRPNPSDVPSGSYFGVLTTGLTRSGPRAPPHSIGRDIGSLTPENQGANVHVRDISILCDNSEGFRAAGQLYGIVFWQMTSSSVRGCCIQGMPNGGIYCFGGRELRIEENTTERCGWFAQPDTCRNGITVIGYISTISPEYSSAAVMIAGNFSNYNYDEGITFANIAGLQVSDNTLIGNRDRGIEGDVGYELEISSAELGYAVPNQTRISRNYVDGAAPSQLGSPYGISVNSGSEGTVFIENNHVMNVHGKSAIMAVQHRGGNIVVRANEISSCAPGLNFHIIYTMGERVEVSDNRIYNTTASEGSTNSCAVVARASATCVVRDNTIEASVTSGISIGARDGRTAVALMVVRGNAVGRAKASSINVTLGKMETVELIWIHDNVQLGKAPPLLHVAVETRNSVAVQRFIVEGNRASSPNRGWRIEARADVFGRVTIGSNDGGPLRI
jgi:hypothetical protein